MTERIELPVGRLVKGHPMVTYPVIDRTTKQQKTSPKTGLPAVKCNFATAIPKGTETDWKVTPWGMKFILAAQSGYSRNEHLAPTFAWKVVDGDSTVANREGNVPREQEAFPGHWVIWAAQGWPCPCYHLGRYEPHQVIQNKEEIKAGDYVRVLVDVRPNLAETPGVYVNPYILELARAGVQIVSSSTPNAAEAFGGSTPVLPTNAQLDTGVAAPDGMPAPGGMTAPGGLPAPDAIEPVTVFTMTPKAGEYTREQYIASGKWTNETLISEGMMTAGVTPAESFLDPGGLPEPGGMPSPQATPEPTYTMTPKAGEYTREQYIASGKWTNETLISEGMMTVS